MANIKLGTDTLTGVNKIRVRNAAEAWKTKTIE